MMKIQFHNLTITQSSFVKLVLKGSLEIGLLYFFEFDNSLKMNELIKNNHKKIFIH